MNLAILKYANVVAKPVDIPDEWPAEVVYLGESTTLPSEEWVLMTEEEYTNHLATYKESYDTWAGTYYGTVDLNTIKKKINYAINFGNELLLKFVTENVAMGITASGKTIQIVQYMANLRNYVATGSLYAAVSELETLIADPDLETNYAPFLTVARLTYYKGLIESFLETL